MFSNLLADVRRVVAYVGRSSGSTSGEQATTNGPVRLVRVSKILRMDEFISFSFSYCSNISEMSVIVLA